MNKTSKPAELSYYGLYLLSHLKENHPDKAGDAAFIEARADHADEVPQSEAPAATLKLLPYLEGVFARYPLSDDFAYSPEYEQLCTELTGAILISLEENGL